MYNTVHIRPEIPHPLAPEILKTLLYEKEGAGSLRTCSTISLGRRHGTSTRNNRSCWLLYINKMFKQSACTAAGVALDVSLPMRSV